MEYCATNAHTQLHSIPAELRYILVTLGRAWVDKNKTKTLATISYIKSLRHFRIRTASVGCYSNILIHPDSKLNLARVAVFFSKCPVKKLSFPPPLSRNHGKEMTVGDIQQHRIRLTFDSNIIKDAMLPSCQCCYQCKRSCNEIQIKCYSSMRKVERKEIIRLERRKIQQQIFQV